MRGREQMVSTHPAPINTTLRIREDLALNPARSGMIQPEIPHLDVVGRQYVQLLQLVLILVPVLLGLAWEGKGGEEGRGKRGPVREGGEGGRAGRDGGGGGQRKGVGWGTGLWAGGAVGGQWVYTISPASPPPLPPRVPLLPDRLQL